MQLNLLTSLGLFSSAILVTGILTPIMRNIALRMSIVDKPVEAHKTHLQSTPYLGGIGILIAVLTISVSASLASKTPFLNLQTLSVVLLPALVIGIVGLVDDIKKLGAWPRFIAQNVTGLFISTVLVVTNTSGSPTGSRIADLALSLIWIVGLTNAVNFFDNIDGGASGTIAISMGTLAILSEQGGQYAISALSTVLAGATIGFLFWNRPPARIYMGDAGSLFLGLLAASLTLRFDPNPINKWSSFALPVLILALPILDTCVAVIARLSKGVSPFQGGKDHLSHRLMKAGLNKRQAVISLWLLSAFFCGFALLISQVSFRFEGILTILASLIWIVLYFWFSRKPGL